VLRKPLSHLTLLRAAGLFTWACVGVTLVLSGRLSQSAALGSSELWLKWGAFALFGIGYWLLSRDLLRERISVRRLALLILLTIAAIAISHASRSGLGGVLLLVVAGVLPWVVPLPLGMAWLVAQNLALIPVFLELPRFNLTEAILQSALYLGFSTFPFITALVAKRQVQAREELRQVNAELRATQALLAESSRMSERVRISRELHDLIGHHLTALSLNLEVASHLSEGKAKNHVQNAQSVAKLLLGDVREVVSQLRHGDDIDLSAALKSLAEGVPAPRIHMALPEQRAQVLLRCAQEIITNAVKHANAENLWMSFERSELGIALKARDDGVGAPKLKAGNGLVGMSERLKQVGGRLNFSSQPGQGFSIEAWFPLAPQPLTAP
jgi:signal transduction histidine kinase